MLSSGFTNMTEQEKADLAILMRQIDDEKIACFGRMSYLITVPPEKHKIYGIRNMEQALIGCIQDSKKVLDKLNADHIRKYPD